MINLHNSKDGKFYFTVTAQNNKVLVTSETYETRRGMATGYKSLQREISLGPEVNDLTRKKPAPKKATDNKPARRKTN